MKKVMITAAALAAMLTIPTANADSSKHPKIIKPHWHHHALGYRNYGFEGFVILRSKYFTDPEARRLFEKGGSYNWAYEW